jgi:hypothetical protein
VLSLLRQMTARENGLSRNLVLMIYRQISRIPTGSSANHLSCLRGQVCTFAIGLILWSATAWGATLAWNANGEPDLAGYRVYRCTQLPCGRTFGSTTLLTTLGRVTNFDIGTPAVTQYYVLTAYDFVNNESSESAVATYTPAGAPPPPPPPTPPPAPTNLQLSIIR